MAANHLILETPQVQIPYDTWEVAKPSASLIFIHGLKSHSAWFLETGEALAKLGIKVYLFDRRGSGRSKEPRGDIDDYHQWLEDILAMVHLAKQENVGQIPHLLGHCFGAKLALAFTIQYPKEVKSLTLIAPPQFSLKADISLREKAKVVFSMVFGMRGEVDVPVKDEMFTRNPDNLRFIQEDSLRLQKMTTQLCIETFKMDRWINKNLSIITNPILILLAKDDRVVDNTKIQNKFYPRLGCLRKELEIFDCYHDLFFEPHREKVFSKILEWVTQ
jgi:alpha-beta hydrolase superfamily lysophospholipase